MIYLFEWLFVPTTDCMSVRLSVHLLIYLFICLICWMVLVCWFVMEWTMNNFSFNRTPRVIKIMSHIKFLAAAITAASETLLLLLVLLLFDCLVHLFPFVSKPTYIQTYVHTCDTYKLITNEIGSTFLFFLCFCYILNTRIETKQIIRNKIIKN